MQDRDIARCHAPENAVNHITPTRRDRAPTIETNEKTMAIKFSRPDRLRTRTPALHRRAVHIGAIGKVELHRPRNSRPSAASSARPHGRIQPVDFGRRVFPGFVVDRHGIGWRRPRIMPSQVIAQRVRRDVRLQIRRLIRRLAPLARFVSHGPVPL